MNSNDKNLTTLRMVTDIESKSLAFVALCRDESRPRDTFQGFRQFIDEVEGFYLYVDVVDNRLPQLKLDKKRELHKHVSQIRWKVMTLMVETSMIYLRNMHDSNRPMPMGAGEFLNSRLNRMQDIDEHFVKYGVEHQLKPLREGILEDSEAIIRELVARCMKLSVFERDPDPVHATGGTPLLSKTPEHHGSLDGRPLSAWAEALRDQEPLSLPMRSEWGRFFMTNDATEIVLAACRRKHISLEELARQLNVSRVSLGLMIRGADAMPREIAANLESFVEQF